MLSGRVEDGTPEGRCSLYLGELTGQYEGINKIPTTPPQVIGGNYYLYGNKPTTKSILYRESSALTSDHT
jgi:hypothetical protein